MKYNKSTSKNMKLSASIFVLCRVSNMAQRFLMLYILSNLDSYQLYLINLQFSH